MTVHPEFCITEMSSLVHHTNNMEWPKVQLSLSYDGYTSNGSYSFAVNPTDCNGQVTYTFLPFPLTLMANSSDLYCPLLINSEQPSHLDLNPITTTPAIRQLPAVAAKSD